MRKVGLFYTVLLIFIVLSACSATKDIAIVDSNDNTEIIVIGRVDDKDSFRGKIIYWLTNNFLSGKINLGKNYRR